jgi:cephalosporin hydroxylase
MLELLHKQDQASYWKVICCDINPVDEAQVLIHQNGFSDRVLFFQGDSASTEFKVLVENAIQDKSESSILLSLDSNHTEEHVFSELISLAGFVTTSSYAIVWDSRIGDLSFLTHYLRPRAWSKRKHAGTGARLFMASIHGQEFTYERSFEQDLLLTGTKYGILLKQ